MDALWEKINDEYKQELRDFINYHSKFIENMTQKEEYHYVKENALNEKIKNIELKYLQKYEQEKKIQIIKNSD